MSAHRHKHSSSERCSVNHREALRLGAAAGVAAWASGGVPPVLLAKATGFGRARSCFIVFLSGGPSHLDTFDPKPDAPVETRGPFKSIPTVVPGLRLCEHLPRLARLADKYAIIRSVSHGEERHDQASHLLLTGREAPETGSEDARGKAHPHIGSALAAHASDGFDPLAFITLPDRLMPIGPIRGGQGAGTLGSRFEPLLLRGHPGRDDFDPLADRPEASAALHRAVSVRDESPRLRDRYGRDLFGQSLLLGRRLLEAGARVIQVNSVRFLDRGWDTHADAEPMLRDDLLPNLDQALSALLEDLAASGLLDETLILVVGEFGRAPKINASAGRDHWPATFSMLLAGAGIPGGRAVGATDRIGAFPVDRPVSPESLAATISFALGFPSPAAIESTGRSPRLQNPARPLLDLWSETVA